MLLCGVGAVPTDCGIKTSKTSSVRVLVWRIALPTSWVLRAGYGLTNDPYEAMELIRASYPILNQVNLESRERVNARPLVFAGHTRGARAGRGQWHPGHSQRLFVDRVSENLHRGYIQSWNVTVQRELPWQLHRPDRLRGDAFRSASSGSSTSTQAS